MGRTTKGAKKQKISDLTEVDGDLGDVASGNRNKTNKAESKSKKNSSRVTEAQFNEGDEQFSMTIEAENDNFSKDDGDDQAEHELNRSTQSEQMENPSRYQGRL